MTRWACALLLWAATHARADEAVQRVDGVVAVVGGLTPGPNVLTLFASDVELRARAAMLRQSDLHTALGPLPPSLLAASLKELIGEALIAAEALRLNMPEPSGDAVEQQRASLQSMQVLLEALGVNERELSAWSERRARVDEFLQANLEGTLDVTEEELEQAFASEAHPFYGEPFEVARARFERWYAGVKLERAVKSWVTTLSQRTPHRVLAEY
ncbi:MAG TPA: hypothetical protein VFX59_27735 [Polyangiales bacterium]|nr:hypothetical protein [Polyangiales bacterium]